MEFYNKYYYYYYYYYYYTENELHWNRSQSGMTFLATLLKSSDLN
jgi:hypothetical protein